MGDALIIDLLQDGKKLGLRTGPVESDPGDQGSDSAGGLSETAGFLLDPRRSRRVGVMGPGAKVVTVVAAARKSCTACVSLGVP